MIIHVLPLVGRTGDITVNPGKLGIKKKLEKGPSLTGPGIADATILDIREMAF